MRKPEAMENAGDRLKARCYCGASSLSFKVHPSSIAYCHCSDCRRWTGAPVAAFAAFPSESVVSLAGKCLKTTTGVKRWFCFDCGSPLAAHFDYLPEQLYIPLGLIDQADQLAPQLHCHEGERLSWLHIADDLDRHLGTARSALSAVHAEGHPK